MRALPFVYPDHAANVIGVAGSLWIGFDAPLTARRLRWMMDTCPFAGTVYADAALFHCESDERFDEAVERLYGDDRGGFTGAVTDWALHVHAKTPIAFVFGPSADGGPWPADRVPDLVEWLEDYLDVFDLPPSEYEAELDDGWPALPMNRLTLSFILDRIPDPNLVWEETGDPDLADRLEDLRDRLVYPGAIA